MFVFWDSRIADSPRACPRGYDWHMLEQTKSGFAPVEGARVNYEVAGQRSPLVMIHAGVADSRQWNNEFSRFRVETGNMDHPDEFHQVVKAFLDGLPV